MRKQQQQKQHQGIFLMACVAQESSPEIQAHALLAESSIVYFIFIFTRNAIFGHLKIFASIIM